MFYNMCSILHWIFVNDNILNKGTIENNNRLFTSFALGNGVTAAERCFV